MNRYLKLVLLNYFACLILICCSRQKETAKHIISNSQFGESELDADARILFHDSKDNYWFTSNENGVYKYDGMHITRYTKDDGLLSYHILRIVEDKKGNIFLDSSEGVHKFNHNKFQKLLVSDTTDIWSGKADDLWFNMGFQHSGPFRYDGQKLQHIRFPKNELESAFTSQYPNASYNPYGIYSIHTDKDNNVWFGTANLGLYLFDGTDIMWQNDPNWTSRPNEMTFGVRSLARDLNGYYWICNSKYKYLRESNPLKTSSELRSINLQAQSGYEKDIFYLQMQADNQGVIWMTTFDNGIWQNDGEKLTQHYIYDGENKITANSMLKDNQGQLWFNTAKSGIYTFQKDTFIKFEL